MTISEDVINQIKERANIVAVIGEHVNLKLSGQNYKGLCPFHSEKTPSFMVSPSKGIFHCFGCGVGGNVFHFLMKFKGVSFPDSVRLLGERVGVPVERGTDDGAARSRADTLYRINGLAASFFESRLHSDAGKRAMDYLLARRLTLPVLREFRVGFAEDSWDSLLSHLRTSGFKTEEIEETGLVVRKRKGQGFYDRFRNRIMFPIFDTIGRCIGFGGRTLESGKPDVPKYLNTNENLLYHKGRYVFGLTNAAAAVRKEDGIIVVEGYVDVVRLHQEGFKNVVAPLGTALTGEQVSLILRHTRNILLAFDGDEAGSKAAVRSAMLIIGSGVDPLVIRLPAGRDPGDFFDEYSGGDFELLVRDAITGIRHIVESHAGGRKDYTANEKIVILTQLIDFYNTINDEILRNSFLDHLSKALNVQRVVLERELDELRPARRSVAPPREAAAKPRKKPGSVSSGVSRELHLLLLVLNNPDIFPAVRGRLDSRHFKGTWTRRLWEAVCTAAEKPRWDSGDVFDFLDHGRFVEYLSGRLMDEVFSRKPHEQAVDLIAALKEREIRGRLAKLNEGLRKAEIENDEPEIGRLIVEKQVCTNELDKLKLLRATKNVL